MAMNTRRRARGDAESRVETSRRPDFRAYTVRGEGDSGFWTPVGAGWTHTDGKGMTVRLEALPLDGKLVLREEDVSSEEA